MERVMNERPIYHNAIEPHEANLPEDIQPVLWWYKGLGCPPYCGCIADEDFPGTEEFFAWSEIPTPPKWFWEKYNSH